MCESVSACKCECVCMCLCAFVLVQDMLWFQHRGDAGIQMVSGKDVERCLRSRGFTSDSPDQVCLFVYLRVCMRAVCVYIHMRVLLCVHVCLHVCLLACDHVFACV